MWRFCTTCQRFNFITINLLMLENQPQQLSQWKADLKSYQKGKRTKKPYGKIIPKVERVTHQDIQSKQIQFNPILQTYRDPRQERDSCRREEAQVAQANFKHYQDRKRYSLPYDIVNLHGSDVWAEKKLDPNKKLGPIRNIHNVVNNRLLPEENFKGREVRLSLERPRHLVPYQLDEYNAITNRYRDEHDHKALYEDEKMRRSAWVQYQKGRSGVDHISGKYYNQNKEGEFQETMERRSLEHGRDMEKKLPPSYLMRESVILDSEKPIPEAFRTLDARRQNAKKRYKQRYIIEDEYRRRNDEDDQKQARIMKNHVHNGRLLEEKARQFDIINSKSYRQDRVENLFGKQITGSTWGKASLTSGKIKSGGFD